MAAIIFMVFLLAITLGLVWFLETDWQRRSPVTPDIVDCTMKPGKTTLRMVDDNGDLYTVLVLRSVGIGSHEGGHAEFVDLTHYMNERTIQRDHLSWCNRGIHTVAEGCSG